MMRYKHTYNELSPFLHFTRAVIEGDVLGVDASSEGLQLSHVARAGEVGCAGHTHCLHLTARDTGVGHSSLLDCRMLHV